MPDLMNPEFTAGEKELIFWPDSRCISCKNAKSCEFIQFIHRNTVYTYSGIHIAHCDLYVPDKSSEYYIPESAGVEERYAANVATLEKALEQLNKVLEKATNVDF